MQPINCVAIGEAMIEIAIDSQGRLTLGVGGDTLNFSIYLARLKPNALNIAYATALGTDPLTKAINQLMQNEGIDRRYVNYDQSRCTGLYALNNDAHGEKIFSYWRNHSAATVMFNGKKGDQLIEAISTSDVIYLSGITLAILEREGAEKLLALVQTLYQQGKWIVFDTNFRANLWSDHHTCIHYHHQIMQNTTHLLASIEDLEMIYPDKKQTLKAHLTTYNINEIILKDAANPLHYYHNHQWSIKTIKPCTTIVDTTAAGDSFNAAYLASRLRQIAIEPSIEYAQQLARLVISHQGAIIDKQLMPQ